MKISYGFRQSGDFDQLYSYKKKKKKTFGHWIWSCSNTTNDDSYCLPNLNFDPLPVIIWHLIMLNYVTTDVNSFTHD